MAVDPAAQHRYALYSYPGNPNAWTTLVAAQFNGVDVAVPAFTFGKDNKESWFLRLNPTGKVPTLKTPQGGLSGSNAIARYVAALSPVGNLFGTNFFAHSQVDQWIDFATNEIYPPATALVLPILTPNVTFDAKVNAEAKKDTLAALRILDAYLQDRTYLVGDAPTLADIVTVCGLVYPFKLALNAGMRKSIPNVVRYFTTLSNLPQFRREIGTVELCAKSFTQKDKVTPQAPSAEDQAAKDEPAPTAVNAVLAKYLAGAFSLPSGAAAAAPAATPAADAATDQKTGGDDDGFDFSDYSDDDEPFALNDDPEYLKKVQAAKDKAAAKEKKSKSHVVIEVKPYEAETDLKVLAEQCKKATSSMAGFEWLGAQFVDVAYGLQKILVSFYAVNSLCNVDEVTELIEEFEDVQSVDIRSFTNA